MKLCPKKYRRKAHFQGLFIFNLLKFLFITIALLFLFIWTNMLWNWSKIIVRSWNKIFSIKSTTLFNFIKHSINFIWILKIIWRCRTVQHNPAILKWIVLDHVTIVETWYWTSIQLLCKFSFYALVQLRFVFSSFAYSIESRSIFEFFS